jgi:ankyrin repeat protein
MDINSIHNIPDGCGNFPATPLWYAYTRGRNEKLFTYLLANGANPDNCMYAIAWYDDAESAGLFKKYGANIDDGSGGDTPFIAAFNWKRFNIAEWFLKHGVNVNFADAKGNTALFYAVKRKYKIEQIKLLLDFGADFDKENGEGTSPKKLAELNKQKKILSLFVPE